MVIEKLKKKSLGSYFFWRARYTGPVNVNDFDRSQSDSPEQ